MVALPGCGGVVVAEGVGDDRCGCLLDEFAERGDAGLLEGEAEFAQCAVQGAVGDGLGGESAGEQPLVAAAAALVVVDELVQQRGDGRGDGAGRFAGLAAPTATTGEQPPALVAPPSSEPTPLVPAVPTGKPSLQPKPLPAPTAAVPRPRPSTPAPAPPPLAAEDAEDDEDGTGDDEDGIDGAPPSDDGEDDGTDDNADDNADGDADGDGDKLLVLLDD